MGRTSNAKERLLVVAQQLFWQQNFSTVSVDTICREAGVNKGSFYYYFSSKVDIVVEAIGALWEEVDNTVCKVCFDPKYRGWERIERLINRIEQGLESQKSRTGFVLGCPFTNIAGEVWARDEAILTKIREILECEKKYYCEVLRDMCSHTVSEGELGETAEQIIAVVSGFVLQAKVMNRPSVIQGALPLLKNLLAGKYTDLREIA